MSSGLILGIAAAVVAVVLIAGAVVIFATRGGDGSADGPPGSSPSSGVPTVSADPTGPTDPTDPPETDDPGSDPSGEVTVDGTASVDGTYTGGAGNDHDIVVPAGVTGYVVVTPEPGFDAVISGEGQEFDDGLEGDVEGVEVQGPFDGTITVYGYGGSTGSYTVEVDAA